MFHSVDLKTTDLLERDNGLEKSQVTSDTSTHIYFNSNKSEFLYSENKSHFSL